MVIERDRDRDVLTAGDKQNRNHVGPIAMTTPDLRHTATIDTSHITQSC